MTNLLQDPSFETGISEWIPWVQAGNPTCTIVQSTAQALFGTHSMLVTTTAQGVISDAWVRTPDQAGTYPVKAGLIYTLSAYLRTSVGAAPAELDLEFRDAGGAYIIDYYISGSVPPTTGWSRIGITAVAPANAVKATLWIGAGYGGAHLGDAFYVDSVQFEPKSFATALYASLGPMQYDEANQHYALAKFLTGIGEEFQTVEDYGRDTDTMPGWAVALTADTCPSEALGWLAQFVGVTLDPTLTDAQQRARIKATDGWNRGTVSAMRGALSGYLTGTKTFAFRERYDVNNPGVDSPYYMQIASRAAETPDPTAALNALLAQKPAGIVLTYTVQTGQDYLGLKTNNATYAIAKSKYATYDAMKLAF